MIGLVDCNSFFCSCERLFQPKLQGVPVIVLSNNDGCVISRTSEAKALGIKMAEPFFKVRSLCQANNVAVFSSNFSLYTDLSRRVMDTLADMAEEVEVYSVDEAWLNLSGFELNELASYSRLISERVLKETGIPVGVGVAPTKVLAKVASKFAKKGSGACYLGSEQEINSALQDFPVEDLWGVGRASSSKLHSLGIRSALQLKNFNNDKLIQKMFTKVGLQLKLELQGINCFPLESKVVPKQEIMCSRSFRTPRVSLKEMREEIAWFASDAAERLRRQESVCREITVFFRTDPFKRESYYYAADSQKFMSGTLDTRKLIRTAHQLLEQNFKIGYLYKKAGVKLTQISSKHENQISLFERSDTFWDEALMAVFDRINYREGKGAIKSAACGAATNKKMMERNFLSPRYTTSLLDLKRVK